MESSSPSASQNPNPFAAVVGAFAATISGAVHHLNSGRNLLLRSAASTLALPPFPPFATLSHRPQSPIAAPPSPPSFDLALAPEFVAKTLAGTSVYTVSNDNNEFVLISDPNNNLRSLGILCFRPEDAQSLLAQVQLRQPAVGKKARVVPISLDQVYMLKVEGIAFRFLPDPLQIKNALMLKSSNVSKGFDGVPVFQSELLVIKKKNKRYCPIYFQKEDIERELYRASRQARGSSQSIMVGSLEDVLKKMEMNDKNSGWDDLIFIPPGKSYTEHINQVAA